MFGRTWYLAAGPIHTENGPFLYPPRVADLDQLAPAIAAASRQEASRVRRRRRPVRPSPATAVVGYVRVSTEEQGDQGAGLEAQRQAIQEACTVRGWRLVAIHQDVASGRSLEGRQGLATALQAVCAGEAAGLIVAKLDRLSRSVIDAAQTIERARREGWNLVALDLGVDFSTPSGEAMAHMTASSPSWSAASSASAPAPPWPCAGPRGCAWAGPRCSPSSCAGGSAGSALAVSPCRRSPTGSAPPGSPLRTVVCAGIRARSAGCSEEGGSGGADCLRNQHLRGIGGGAA